MQCVHILVRLCLRRTITACVISSAEHFVTAAAAFQEMLVPIDDANPGVA